MTNEIMLIASLIVVYGMVLLWFALLGERGLCGWTVFAAIAANIEVMILIEAFGMQQTLGNVMFASTFLTTDILSEVYGKKAANRAVNIGIITSLSFIVISQTWLLFTPSVDDVLAPSIHAVFSNTPRFMLVGFLVYAIVQRLDVWLYHMLWQLTEKRSGRRKFLWLRNNASTLISQMLNTVLFTFGAFWGVYDMQTMLSIMVASYIIFIITSLADTPIVYLARVIHEKRKAPGIRAEAE